MRARWPGVLIVVVLVFAFGGCGDDGEDRPDSAADTEAGTEAGTETGTHAHGEEESAEPAFSQDEADTVLQVEGLDYEFVLDQDTVQGPRVYFEFTNNGEDPHELLVLDPDGEELGEVHLEETGTSGDLALELDPGTYTLTCLIERGDETHAELGMETTLTVE